MSVKATLCQAATDFADPAPLPGADRRSGRRLTLFWLRRLRRDTRRGAVVHQQLAATLDAVLADIRRIQQQARQATQNREQTNETVLRLVREAFKCLVAPSQLVKPSGELGDIEWEMFPLNAAVPGLGKEIARVLAENELVIREWAPIHLHAMLKRWFWKDGAVDVAAVDT